jgi:hypothetical protein
VHPGEAIYVVENQELMAFLQVSCISGVQSSKKHAMLSVIIMTVDPLNP